MLSSFQYWFQNRRAKSRKEERKVHVTSVYQISPSNQFGRPVSRAMPFERPQFPIQSPSDHWKQAERLFHPVMENRLQVRPRSRSVKADNHYSSFKSSQFRSHSSFQIPRFHPDQFKRRPTEPSKLS